MMWGKLLKVYSIDRMNCVLKKGSKKIRKKNISDVGVKHIYIE